MIKYIKSQKNFLALSFVVSLICSLLNIGLVYFIQSLVDAISTGNQTSLTTNIALLVFFLISSYVMGNIAVIVEGTISKKLNIELKNDLFLAFVNQKYANYRKIPIGEKLNVFENDVKIMEEYYFNGIFSMIRNSFLMIFSLIYLLRINLMLGILLFICSLTILILPMLLGKNIESVGDGYASYKGKFVSQVKDYFDGMNVIHSYGIETKITESFIKILEKLENKLFLLKKKIGCYNQLITAANFIIIIASFSIGSFMVFQHKITMGELIAITQIMNLMMSPMSEITQSAMKINGSIAVKEKLEHILNDDKGYCKPDNLPQISDFSGIECENISYQQGDFHLNNISLKLEPGKKYVIVGSSGCGKSTLMKIIGNMLEPSKGQLYINQAKYTETENSIPELISYVYQDSFIFNDTIENNITLYSDYNKEKFDYAVKTSCLKEKIGTRINSECSEHGENLSGGEKQRIALARALLKGSPVLLLDEVTSALDRTTADTIENNVFSMTEKTVLYITHKIESNILKKADCIFYMDNGSIIERGSWNQLMSNKGYFFNTYSLAVNH